MSVTDSESLVTTSTTGSLLSLDTAGLASLEDGGSGALDVGLGGDTDHEGRNVDGLLANSDVSLLDEDAGVMDGVGEAALLHKGLQSSLEELGGGQTENVIELALVVLEETEAHHSADEGLTY